MNILIYYHINNSFRFISYYIIISNSLIISESFLLIIIEINKLREIIHNH